MKNGLKRFSRLLRVAVVLSFPAGTTAKVGAQGLHDSFGARSVGRVDAVSLQMSAARWKQGSVPTIGFMEDGQVVQRVSVLDVPGRHNAELHWYSPEGVVMDADLDPTLTDAEGAQNHRPVLALSIPRRPITAAASDTLWVSLTYPLDPVGVDLTRSDAIELWINDWRDEARVRGPGLKLHVDVGMVSEDQMRSPDQPPNGLLDSEDRIPRDGVLRPEEDTGLDGKGDSAGDGLSAPLDLVTATDQDRAGDDYAAPDGQYAMIDPRRWIRSNGTEGNRSVSPDPDSEDLNLNGYLDTEGNYFEYTIDLSDTSRRYLTTDVYAEFEGKSVPYPPGPDNGWRRYRVPIDDSGRVRFGVPNLSFTRHVRIWVDGIVSADGPEDAVSHQERPLLMLAGPDRAPDVRETIDTGSPNPFVGSTTFAYALDARARVHAVVLDLQGREVATVENSDQEAGHHAFTWDGRQTDGRRAAAGLYFVKARIQGRPDRLWRVIRLR